MAHPTAGADASKELLFVDDVTAATGLGRSTIYRALAAGQLRGCKVGDRTVIRRADFQKWLDNLPPFETPADRVRSRRAA